MPKLRNPRVEALVAVNGKGVYPLTIDTGGPRRKVVEQHLLKEGGPRYRGFYIWSAMVTLEQVTEQGYQPATQGDLDRHGWSVEPNPNVFIVHGIRSLKNLEKDYIEWIMARVGQNGVRAADLLGVSYKTLYNKGFRGKGQGQPGTDDNDDE